MNSCASSIVRFLLVFLCATGSWADGADELPNTSDLEKLLERAAFYSPAERWYLHDMSGQSDTGKDVDGVALTYFQTPLKRIAFTAETKACLAPDDRKAIRTPIGRLAAAACILFDKNEEPICIVLRVAGSDCPLTFAPVVQRDQVIFQVDDKNVKWKYFGHFSAKTCEWIDRLMQSLRAARKVE